MRTVKFRAWDGCHMRPVGISGYDLSPSEDGTWYEQYDVNASREWMGEVMLNTGLKDENGVEIFEGDIVRILPNNPNGYVAEVYWQDGGFETTSVDGDSSTAFHATIYEAYGKCEVIGNIYANPELLEGKS